MDALCSPYLCAEVGDKVLDEVRGEFQHRHIRATIVPLDECCRMITRTYHYLIGTHGAVFAHPFQEVGIVLVEGSKQRLILSTQALIGIAHHLSRDECLTV